MSGNLKLLVSHTARASTVSSDLSTRSTHSSRNSSSSLRQPNPIYAEIIAPTGFRVGEQKCIVLRKVRVNANYQKVLYLIL